MNRRSKRKSKRLTDWQIIPKYRYGLVCGLLVNSSQNSNEQCIDPENGLLLKPDNDFLFDQGYISFNDDGSIIISKMLSTQNIQEFHLSKEIRIKQVTPKMKEYLNYHREKVFKK